MTVAPAPVYVNPIGPGLTQGRVDQGVDYTGTGPLYAVGSGTILSTFNSGWGPPNGESPGAFIALKLDNPPDPQHSIFYYAEGINPAVQPGQQVTAGQLVGQANGNSIEVGWGSAAAIGQALAGAEGEFTGSNATQEGQNALSFLQSIGGGTSAQLTATSGSESSSSGPGCSGCAISSPGSGVPIIGSLVGGCLISHCQLKAARAALLIAVGGAGMLAGLALLSAFGLAHTQVGRAVTSLIPGGRLLGRIR